MIEYSKKTVTQLENIDVDQLAIVEGSKEFIEYQFNNFVVLQDVYDIELIVETRDDHSCSVTYRSVKRWSASDYMRLLVVSLFLGGFLPWLMT